MNYSINNQNLKVVDSQVFAAEDCLPLSIRGHACLILFLNSNNKTISKESLMKSLWQDIIVSDDSIFKVIQEVRKVLRQLGMEGELVVNVYGKGYQWTPETLTNSNETGSKYWYKASLIAVILLGLWALFYESVESQLSDDSFDHFVSMIKAGFGDDENLVALMNGQTKHPLDQLKITYLRGLINYKSGDYESSIDELTDGVSKFEGQPNHQILADTYLLLSKMYIYREDKAALKEFLDKAQAIYGSINDAGGLISTSISRARYHQVMFEFPESIKILNEVLLQSTEADDVYNQMRVYSNLAYSYQQTHQKAAYINALENALELALQISDGGYAAYAYGALSEVYLKQADFIKAMKYAQLALQYVLGQNDTNVFQQGFSAFYNLLHELGHTELAEKYLQRAIDIQKHFNDQGVLVQAAMHLSSVKSSLGKTNQSQTILKELLASSLTTKELQEVNAMYALNALLMKDNIDAYTRAKPIFLSENASIKARIHAGIAYVLSSNQLERVEETESAIEILQQLVHKDWLLSYDQFIETAQFIYGQALQDDKLSIEYFELKKKSNLRREQIKAQTIPQQALMDQLDLYISNILK